MIDAEVKIRHLIPYTQYDAILTAFEAITMFEPKENKPLLRLHFFTSVLLAYCCGLKDGAREVEKLLPKPPQMGRAAPGGEDVERE